MRNRSILRCALMGAVGCGLASAAVADEHPYVATWKGEVGADWSAETSWDLPVTAVDTAMFPAGNVSTVRMDGVTSEAVPAAAFLTVGANGSLTMFGGTENWFKGTEATAKTLLDEGASLMASGAGTKVYLRTLDRTVGYKLASGTTMTAAEGAYVEVDCGDANGSSNVRLVADGKDSKLDYRDKATYTKATDITFEATDGGYVALHTWTFNRADVRVSVKSSGGATVYGSSVSLNPALLQIDLSDGGACSLGYATPAAGSYVRVGSKSFMQFAGGEDYTSYFGKNAMTIELSGESPTFLKYGMSAVTFGDNLTIKLRPESNWSASEGRIRSDSKYGAFTVSGAIHYEIDVGAMGDLTTAKTFRLFERLNTSGGDKVTLNTPSAANVKVLLNGVETDEYAVSFTKGTYTLDVTVKQGTPDHPYETVWIGETGAKWSEKTNWKYELTSVDTAVFPDGKTSEVLMDVSSTTAKPAANGLRVNQGGSLVVTGGTVNYIGGKSDVTLLGVGASLTVSGAGTSLGFSDSGQYALQNGSTLKALDGGKLAVGPTHLKYYDNLTFLADGADSELSVKAISESTTTDSGLSTLDLRFEAQNGGKVSVTGGPWTLAKGSPRPVFLAKNGSSVLASGIKVSVGKVTMDFDQNSAGAINAVKPNANGSSISIGTGSSLSVSGEFSNNSKTSTLSLSGDNPMVTVGGAGTFNTGLTVKLTPKKDWSATDARILCSSKTAAVTVAEKVKYEIDVSEFAGFIGRKRFRLFAAPNTTGTKSLAVPTAANVKVTGNESANYEVEFKVSDDKRYMDCVVKRKGLGLIFSIR